MAFDRFNDKPARRFGDRGNRFGEERGNRFGEDRGNRFGEERGERFGEARRGRFGEERGNRFSDERDNRDGRRFEGRKKFGDKPFADRRRPSAFEGNMPSGPRARAVQVRKYVDKNIYASRLSVRLDADVAKYFKTPEDVNAALRQVIALSGLVKGLEAAAVVPQDEAQPQAAEEADEVPADEAEAPTEAPAADRE